MKHSVQRLFPPPPGIPKFTQGTGSRTKDSSLDWCPAVLGTGHHSFPSHTSRGQGRAVLQPSELRFSINWDPPAPRLMVNSCGIACACSFCAQMLPISTPIQRSSSDKLKPYVSCLLSAYLHSDSDRVHGSDAPVAVHEAGEAQPSGLLLSGEGSSRESTQHVPQSACPTVWLPDITGSIKERARREGAEDWQWKKKKTSNPQPFSSLEAGSRRREGGWKKNNNMSAQSPCLHHSQQNPTRLQQTHSFALRAVRLWSSLLQGSKDVPTA